VRATREQKKVLYTIFASEFRNQLFISDFLNEGPRPVPFRKVDATTDQCFATFFKASKKWGSSYKLLSFFRARVEVKRTLFSTDQKQAGSRAAVISTPQGLNWTEMVAKKG